MEFAKSTQSGNRSRKTFSGTLDSKASRYVKNKQRTKIYSQPPFIKNVTEDSIAVVWHPFALSDAQELAKKTSSTKAM